MSTPKVSYFDLEAAFLYPGEDRRYWLDRHTGRVLSYSGEASEAILEGTTEKTAQMDGERDRSVVLVQPSLASVPLRDRLQFIS